MPLICKKNIPTRSQELTLPSPDTTHLDYQVMHAEGQKLIVRKLGY